MHTIYLSDIVDSSMVTDDDGNPNTLVLTARVHIDYKIGDAHALVEVSRKAVHVVCPERPELGSQLYPSRDVVMAARLFGKLK